MKMNLFNRYGFAILVGLAFSGGQVLGYPGENAMIKLSWQITGIRSALDNGATADEVSNMINSGVDAVVQDAANNKIQLTGDKDFPRHMNDIARELGTLINSDPSVLKPIVQKIYNDLFPLFEGYDENDPSAFFETAAANPAMRDFISALTALGKKAGVAAPSGMKKRAEPEVMHAESDEVTVSEEKKNVVPEQGVVQDAKYPNMSAYLTALVRNGARSVNNQEDFDNIADKSDKKSLETIKKINDMATTRIDINKMATSKINVKD